MNIGRMAHLGVALALACLLAPAALAAQQRFTIAGSAAIYDLVGEVKLEPTTGSSVVAAVQTLGSDRGQLRVLTGRHGDWETLRVVFPEERIVYDRARWEGSTSLNVRADGTFNDRSFWHNAGLAGPEGGEGHKITVSGTGSGTHAWADVVIGVPAGRRVAVFLGIGRVEARNINGHIWLSTSAGDALAERLQGNLNVSSGSGDLRITDVTGDVVLSTGSGDVVLEGARGNVLKLSTGSGDVRATTLAVPQLEASTGSGDLSLQRVSAPRANVSAGSGDINLELVAALENLEASSGSGDVTLSLPAATGARINIETGSGEIHTALPVTVTSRRGGHSLTGTLGDGRGNIEVSTGSGDVRLDRR